jgi:hypothetical protein
LPYIRGQSMTFVARRAPQPVDFGARPQACKRSPSDPGRR